MTTTWVIREEGDRLIRQDGSDSLAKAIILAEEWITAREIQGYTYDEVILNVNRRSELVKLWRLKASSLTTLTISIVEWD